MRHPCQSGHRCTCHSAGPSNKTTTTLIIAALVAPVVAAPAPVTLPFLYPTLALERRVTDAGQAPDDPSEGFLPQPIQLSDLTRAGLPYKFVYDPTAEVARDVVAGVDVDISETSGAWVVEDAWQLHGKRFGPLSATATADITDDPLPTQTEPVATASATASTTSAPTILAIESTLPTGWADDAYRRSGMYAIPLVVSFSVVIALMIGSLIGALAIRRDRSRSRRRKKRLVGDDDSAVREKTVRKGLAARVGRALGHNENTHSRPESPDLEPENDVEVGQPTAERQRDQDERSDLESRVKVWARKSASWRVQARVGMRRRMTRGRKRPTADSNLDVVEVIHEDREGEERVEREQSRATTPVQRRTSIDRAEEPPPEPSPAVPTYSSTSSSPAAGPSTPRDHANDAHADAAPSDEPAYDNPGAGDGLPPAYRRGETRAEVRRGKMPMRSEPEPEPEIEVRRSEPEPQRTWTALDAYAFGEAEDQEGGVTAHVATDDKRVLERLRAMRGAPEDSGDGLDAEAPREEDVFGAEVVDESGSGPAGPLLGSGSAGLPPPSSKSGAGQVARYGEADLSLPRYLDGPGPSEAMMLVPSAPPEDQGGLLPSVPPVDEAGLVPSAPPVESTLDVPSAPPLEDDGNVPSAPFDTIPSAPPLHDASAPSAPPMDEPPTPSAPTLNGSLTPASPALTLNTPYAPSL